MEESRFKRVANDPRFKKIPRKQRKVKIDARFQRMFTDKSFTTKYFVDKRGAVVGKTTKEDLHKFYDLSDDEEKDVKPDQTETTVLPSVKTSKVTKKRKGKKDVSLKGMKTKDSKLKMTSNKLEINDDQNKDEQEIEDEADDKSSEADDNNDYVRVKGDVESDDDDDYARGEGDVESSSSDNDDNEKKTDDIDYARGEGSIESSNDEGDDNQEENIYRLQEEDDDDDDDESDEGEILDVNKDEPEHDWGEADKSAKTREDATRRIAVCSLDWDKLTARDLYVLFSSMGSKGVIQSVKIYPSEFGLERMKMEESYGPEELRNSETDKDIDKHGNNEEGSEFSKEKLRQYQLNKLKYYYAVIECDKPETANFLYEECDGVEFEMTGNLLDLRFIPDEMIFNHEPTSVATEMPDMANYTPPEFETAALHHSSVKLTWDETDASRIKTTMRKFSKNDLQDMDFQAYLASSSEEEEEGEEGRRSDGEESDDEEGRIAKYKRLLQDIDSNEHDDDQANEMEITWEPGLQDSAQDLLTRKAAEKKDRELTPWQKYLNKKNEKRKEKRKQKNEQDDDARSDVIPDDVDMSDPFFSQDFGPEFPSNTKHTGGDKHSKKKKKKKGRGKKDELDTAEEKKNKEELELLLMDDNDEKQHFSLKGILESEKTNKKKKRRSRGKQDDKANVDEFEVNVNDPRFTAMYTSHHYAIDPSDQQFKRTKGVDAILKERHRRRDQPLETPERSSQTNTSGKTKADRKKAKDSSLSLLVKSVKSKTEEFQHRKKKRKTVHET